MSHWNDHSNWPLSMDENTVWPLFSTELFLKIIHKLIDPCEGTTNMLDDIAIAGVDMHDHNRKLTKVLQRLSEYNVTINLEKSEFA